MAAGDFKVTIDQTKLKRALKRVPKLLAIGVEYRMKRVGREFERVVDDIFTAQLTGPWKANKTMDKLANRSGSLRRSFRQGVYKPSRKSGAADLVLRATIGNARTAHYVFTQENGDKDRRSSSGKLLTIPAPDNLTAAGRPRFTSPSQVPDLFFIQLGSGTGDNGFAALAIRKGEGISVLWILKRSVSIKPRLGFVKRWNSKRMTQLRITQLNAAVTDTLKKAKLA